MITKVLQQLAEGVEPGRTCPDPKALGGAIRDVMEGRATAGQIAALLMGLRCRGELAEHIKSVVDVMLDVCRPFPTDENWPQLFDTCGTGGDRHGTVNISTAAALLAATAGLPVAKHGNRAMSSRSGSADVLEALGVKIDLDPAHCASLLKETNFTFLFAPSWHPAMRHAGPVRRELRFRSIFNIAGPLSNPAHPTHQLVGVSDPDLVEPVAETLSLLGRRRALVVHGANGEDEISLTQITTGLHLNEKGELESFYLEPSELGLRAVELAELVADGPEDSAARVREVLEGRPGPIADVINLNLAAVIFLSGREPSMVHAFNHAREVQGSGKGLETLNQIIELSQGSTQSAS